VFSARFGAPLLLVFLGLGVLAGEEGPGGILFRDFHAAYLIGSIALAIILGDDLRHPIPPVCREVPTIRAFPAVTGVIVVRERPVGGGPKRLENRGETGEGIAAARCGRRFWYSEQVMVRAGRIERSNRNQWPTLGIRAAGHCAGSSPLPVTLGQSA
jgi:hypothetical protein